MEDFVAKVTVSPHEFQPIWRSALINRGRCRQCYEDEAKHPTTEWVPARFAGDRSKTGNHPYINKEQDTK